MLRERILGQREYMLEAAIQALLRCGVTSTLRKRIAMLIQEEALLCVVRRLPLPREALGSIGFYMTASDIGQMYTDIGYAVAACALVEEAEVFNVGGGCGRKGICCFHYRNDTDVELEYHYNLMARLFVKVLRWIRSHTHRYVRTAHLVGLHTRATTIESMWTSVPKAFHSWGNVHGKPCECGYTRLCRERFWDLARSGQSKSFTVPNMRKNLIAKRLRQESGYDLSAEDMRDLCNTLPRDFAHAISTPETRMSTLAYLDDIAKCPALLHASRASRALCTQSHAVVVIPSVGCESRYVHTYNRRVVAMIPRTAERVDVVVRAGAFHRLFKYCGFLPERCAEASLAG